jgi:hypothetical protein
MWRRNQLMRIVKGDRVRVKKLTEKKKAEMAYVDPESVFYLDKFEGKEGQVFDITKTSGGFTNFHVNFGKDIGIFYENEVEHVTK